MHTHTLVAGRVMACTVYIVHGVFQECCVYMSVLEVEVQVVYGRLYIRWRVGVPVYSSKLISKIASSRLTGSFVVFVCF